MSDSRRQGIRVKVNHNDGIEAVIYASSSFPDFSDDYEINLGGIKLFSKINCDVGQFVTVSIFGSHKDQVKLQGKVIESQEQSVVIAFSKLNEQQQDMLCKILELQQAL